jgi:hypothetical protein
MQQHQDWGIRFQLLLRVRGDVPGEPSPSSAWSILKSILLDSMDQSESPESDYAFFSSRSMRPESHFMSADNEGMDERIESLLNRSMDGKRVYRAYSIVETARSIGVRFGHTYMPDLGMRRAKYVLVMAYVQYCVTAENLPQRKNEK